MVVYEVLYAIESHFDGDGDEEHSHESFHGGEPFLAEEPGDLSAEVEEYRGGEPSEYDSEQPDWPALGIAAGDEQYCRH